MRRMIKKNAAAFGLMLLCKMIMGAVMAMSVLLGEVLNLLGVTGSKEGITVRTLALVGAMALIVLFKVNPAFAVRGIFMMPITFFTVKAIMLRAKRFPRKSARLPLTGGLKGFEQGLETRLSAATR
jgi:hypothetical protein